MRRSLTILFLLLTAAAAAAVNWYSLYLNGEKIGYSYSNSVPITRGENAGGVWIESYSTMQLLRDGRSMLTSSRRRELYNATGELLKASDHQLSGTETTIITAELEGDVLAVSTTRGVIQGKDYLEGGLPGSLGTHFVTGGAGPGESVDYRCYASDYSRIIEGTLSRGALEVLEIDGESFEGYHNINLLDGVPRDIYLTAAGELVLIELPGGMRIRPAVDEAAAKADVGWVDPTASAAIFPTGVIEAPRKTRRLVLEVAGGRRPPAGPFQVVADLDDGRWLVTVTNYALEAPPPATEPERPEFDRTLDNLAASLTSDDPYDTLADIADWVADNLAELPVGVELTAPEIYARRRGDCSEHAALVTDLARRAGLHCRTVVGLLYLEGAFYYHAWNEAWADDQWRSLDAYLDQLPADAARLGLAYDPKPDERRSFFAAVDGLVVREAE